MNEKEVKEFYQKRREAARSNPVEWGKYLICPGKSLQEL